MTPRKRPHAFVRTLGGSLFALFCCLVIGALQFMGVLSMILGHVLLFVAGVVGTVAIFIDIFPGKSSRKIAGSLGLWAVLIIGDVSIISYKGRIEAEHVGHLQVRSLTRSGFEAGRTPFVDIGLKYSGNDSVRVRGYYYTDILPDLLDELGNPDARAALEDAAWSRFKSRTMTAADFSAPAGDFVTSVHGARALSENEVRQLLTGTHAALIVMGTFEWAEHGRVYATDFCAFSHGKSLFMLCRNHNGPVPTKSD